MKALGAVAAGHPETAAVAAAILAEGGNAFDATVAAMCAACVTEPVLASLGGGGFLMARAASAAPVLYDFFAQTPLVPRPADEIAFAPIMADFGQAQQEFHIGMGAMATPGVVGGIFRVHGDLCSMPLARLVEPAARLAREGVAVNELQGYILDIVKPIYVSNPAVLAAYGSQREPGRPVTPGEMLAFPDFADTLEALAAEGEDLFYRGDIAKRLVADCEAHGGQLTAADLEAYRVEVRRPLEIGFAGARVFTNPPPSTGGILVGFGLEMLKDGGLDGLDRGSAAYLSRLARVLDLTNRARVEAALHELPADAAARALLDPALIARYRAEVAGRPAATRGTTHISVIDAAGNAAGVTVTNGEGVGYTIPGTGIMMNNLLGEEDINPHGFFNWPADLRLASMMAPSLVARADDRLLSLGSGGSNRIRTAILQVLLNILAFDMEPGAAVTAPRLHVEGDLASVETPGFAAEALAALDGVAPRTERWEALNLFFGGVHCAGFDPRSGRFEGAGDPRRGGVFVVA